MTEPSRDFAARHVSAAAPSPVRWTEVRALAPDGWAELVADALSVPGTTGVAFGPPSLGSDPAPAGFEIVRSYVPDHADGPALRARIERALGSLAERTGATELAGLGCSFRELPPEDWAASWRKSWKPFRLGRLLVVPAWLAVEPRPGELRLELEPGGAFGSGRHPTTRDCLRALAERLAPGARVLDAGCGSGILSVAAVLHGAGEVLGFDVDPSARAYAEDLARRNGALERCEFRTGGFEVLTAADGSFDVVLANIYSDVLQAHARDLAARLTPGGWFAFSGCPDRHRDATVAALEAAGLRIEVERRRGRWCTFLGRTPPRE